jgi:SET domain-containing protein
MLLREGSRRRFMAVGPLRFARFFRCFNLQWSSINAMAESQTTAAVASGQLTEVKPSPLHGFGLFAVRHIPADTFLGCYAGPIVYDEEDDGEYVLWVLEEDGTGYGIDGRNELRYVNHHADSNAIFYEEELWTTRDIAPGEEICHHYGDDWD